MHFRKIGDSLVCYNICYIKKYIYLGIDTYILLEPSAMPLRVIGA